MTNAAMDIRVIETVAAFATVVALCIMLKRHGTVREEHGPLFAGLLTQAALPAVIFTQLSSHPILPRHLLMILIIIVAGLVSMAASWLLGKALHLERPRIGALMLTSSFGSSALLGYPIIEYTFPDNPQAFADAVLMSEVGVGLPIFILGPLIASIFGESAKAQGTLQAGALTAYFRSPIFFALIAGVAASQFPWLRATSWLAPFWEALHMINGALTTLACMVLALQLKVSSLKGIWPLLVGSALIQMLLQPWVAHAQAELYRLPAVQSQVVVLLTSMPAAVLGPVFAVRYKCAGDTASALVMIHILMSAAFIPLSFAILNR